MMYRFRTIGLAFSAVLLAAQAYAEDPVRVGACQLVKDPAAYNHKLIEVSGLVSYGFEDFTLFDSDCRSDRQVWLEYGGTVSSGAVFCCGPNATRTRPNPLRVEEIDTSLLDDDLSRRFDREVQREEGALMRAKLIGRFFAGRPGGYGHFGCCSLFVIQQVLSVEPQQRAGEAR